MKEIIRGSGVLLWLEFGSRRPGICENTKHCDVNTKPGSAASVFALRQTQNSSGHLGARPLSVFQSTTGDCFGVWLK